MSFYDLKLTMETFNLLKKKSILLQNSNINSNPREGGGGDGDNFERLQHNLIFCDHFSCEIFILCFPIIDNF